MMMNDDGDEGQINFSVPLSPKTTRTRNNKPKQWNHVIVVSDNLTFLDISNVPLFYYLAIIVRALAMHLSVRSMRSSS